MYNPFTLAGKTILITGASSGIGMATAVECSKMGATLCITGRNKERLAETFSMMEGVGHCLFVADMTDEQQIIELAAALPPLAGVVHCAGVAELIPAKCIETEDIQRVMSVNLYSVLLLNRELITGKKLNKNCSIVYISSLTTHTNLVGNTLYSASKAALTASAKVLQKELTSIGARVNIISPGVVETPITEMLSEEQKQAEQSKYLYGLGKPEDVAMSAIFLLSDASRWVVGSEMILHGGVL